jgi:hypothetical protein
MFAVRIGISVPRDPAHMTDISIWIATYDRYYYSWFINSRCNIVKYSKEVLFVYPAGLVVAVKDHEHFRLKMLFTQKKKIEHENKQIRIDRDNYKVTFILLQWKIALQLNIAPLTILYYIVLIIILAYQTGVSVSFTHAEISSGKGCQMSRVP